MKPKTGIAILGGLLAVLFLILRITDFVDWPWWLLPVPLTLSIPLLVPARSGNPKAHGVVKESRPATSHHVRDLTDNELRIIREATARRQSR